MLYVLAGDFTCQVVDVRVEKGKEKMKNRIFSPEFKDEAFALWRSRGYR
jgi:hypothetical protein